MKRSAVLAAVILGSASFCGVVSAAPSQHNTAVTAGSPVRMAAGDKKEVEGTKADIKEDRAEAKAMTHHRVKHHRHKAAANKT